jgi:AcrR family transcriptional regulator
MITVEFGGKAGLERVVAERLAHTIEGAAAGAFADHEWPFAEFLQLRRAHPRVARLIVRVGLGDLDPETVLAHCTVGDRLVASIETLRGGSARRPTQRSQLAAYGALCGVLGAYTFDDFNVRGSQCSSIPEATRTATLAEALELIARLAADDSADLRLQRHHKSEETTTPRVTARGRTEIRDALITAAIEMFAEHGPAAISIRAIAEHAGVGHGLIHRYFGSKEALLNAAIDRLAIGVTTRMVTSEGLDVAALVHLQRRSLNPWIIGRQMADGVDVASTRSSFPLIQAVVDSFPEVPTEQGPGNLTDPRLAVYAVSSLISGAAIWDRPVRELVGLPTGDDVDTDNAVTLFARRILEVPRGSHH